MSSAPARRRQQRFHMQATWLAADTEFWRAHRKAAAVMHFTTLGYSRPDGQTSDHWTKGGVAKLQWEPEFYRYVRDAFAPVGLMVDYWNDRPLSGTKARVPVVLINDLYRPWKGPVTLRVKRGERVLVEARQDAGIEPLGTANVAFDIAWPEASRAVRIGSGIARRRRRSRCAASATSRSSSGAVTGLAFHKPVTASSTYAAPTSRRMPWTATPTPTGLPNSRTAHGWRWTSAR